MCEIKFRAWDKENKEMLYQGSNTTQQNSVVDCRIVFDEFGYSVFVGIYGGKTEERKNTELMQFTGLREKNGREVYEEDICRDGNGRIGVVKCFGGTRYMPNGYGGFEQFGLYAQNADGSWTHFKKTDFYRLEVIGNIYENPEILSDIGR